MTVVLPEIRETGVDWYIGGWFNGNLADADGLVLLPPSISGWHLHLPCSAMWHLLSICESFIPFMTIMNVIKCKLDQLFNIPFSLLPSRSQINVSFLLPVRGNTNNNADQWPHVGPIFSITLDDTAGNFSYQIFPVYEVSSALHCPTTTTYYYSEARSTCVSDLLIFVYIKSKLSASGLI